MLIGVSCKKEDKHEGFQTTYSVSYPDRIFLTVSKETDTSVTLKWTPLESECFHYYYVLRETIDDSSTISTSYVIESIENQKEVTFTDKDLPLASKVKYQIYGSSCYGSFFSNLVYKERPNVHTMEIYEFKDALIDRDANAIYIVDNGSYYEDTKITKYNYNTFTEEATASVNVNFGFGDLGVYNNSKELYLPYSNYSYGSIYVFDANTLNIKSQIPHNEYDLASVAYNDNKFFLGVDDYSYSVKCHSREDFSFIDGLGYFYNESRVEIIPGTTTELIAIEAYGDIGYYQFSSDGEGVAFDEDYSSSSTSTGIFEVSPAGNIFITSSSGAIYLKDLTYQGSLSYSMQYSCFTFSEDGSKIYAGSNYNSNVDVYNSENRQLIETINIGGFPKKLFVDGSSLISVSLVEDEYNNTTYAIETINLTK